MANLERNEQEMGSGLEVITWIEHLKSQPDVTVELDQNCYFNKLMLARLELVLGGCK